MIGYCATGSCGTVIAPIRQMNSAMTHAKMGRSMKKEGMAGAYWLALTMVAKLVSTWSSPRSLTTWRGFTSSPGANF